MDCTCLRPWMSIIPARCPVHSAPLPYDRAWTTTTTGTHTTLVATTPIVDARSSGGRLQPMTDPYRPRPKMPQLWDGDNS